MGQRYILILFTTDASTVSLLVWSVRGRVLRDLKVGQSDLWPPPGRFQSAFWQSFPQYFTALQPGHPEGGSGEPQLKHWLGIRTGEGSSEVEGEGGRESEG